MTNLKTIYKKRIKYLLLVTVDLINLYTKNDSKVIEIYNSIYNSDKITSSVKERKKFMSFKFINKITIFIFYYLFFLSK